MNCRCRFDKESETKYKFNLFNIMKNISVMHDQKMFNKWLKSDNVFKSGVNSYKTQCTQYVPTFTLEKLQDYFKKEYLTAN